MACDLQYTWNDKKWKGKPKIFKFGPLEGICDSEFIIGFAGGASELLSIVDYFTMPDVIKPPRVKNVSGLVLTARREIFLFDTYQTWLPVLGDCHAGGSGGSIALGAMSLGASPKEAIKIASKHDVYSGMGVYSLRFD